MKKIARRAAKIGATLVIAVPAILVSTSASAAPAATKSITVKASATASPNVVATCAVEAIAPSQPLYHGPAYGQAKYLSCVGAPKACRLVVDLQKLEPQGYYVTVGHAIREWSTCNTKILTSKPPYACPGGYGTSTYTTLVTSEIEASDGTPGPSHAFYSNSVNLACT